ncbi:MAG: hypothetical protein KKA32_12920 [Actinobacteria bacterium]|nr:hypothetical protein [Actinomycetota bacterium]
MIDLNPVLESVARGKGGWRVEDAELIAVTVLVREKELMVDWDRGAGERWIRLVSRTDVLVLVTTAPIVFVLTPSAIRVAEFPDYVDVVEAASLDASLYRCREDLVECVFPGVTSSLGFDASSFSVMDLWYSTI